MEMHYTRLLGEAKEAQAKATARLDKLNEEKLQAEFAIAHPPNVVVAPAAAQDAPAAGQAAPVAEHAAPVAGQAAPVAGQNAPADPTSIRIDK
jgi:hypothetical protein